MTGVVAPDVSVALVEYLRSRAGPPSLDYEEAPASISGGFDTAIYGFRLRDAPEGLAGPLILRVYRDGGERQARFEAAVQRGIRAQDFPCPRVLLVCDDSSVLGGAFMVMERVAGVPMVDRMLGPRFQGMATLLGRTHGALHRLDPDLLTRQCDDETVARLETISEHGWATDVAAASLEGLARTQEWIEDNWPVGCDRVICHHDFHPLNVMVDRGSVSGVLDWANTRIGDPAWDVGAVVALLGHGPVDLPRPLMPVVDFVRKLMTRRYLHEYERARPLDLAQVRFFEAVRLFGFLLEAGITRQAQAGVIGAVSKRTAFDEPRVITGIARRLSSITGVAVELPAGG